VDAHGDAHGWTPVDELDREERIQLSAGWVVDDPDLDHVTVIQTVDASAELVDHVIHLPRVMVRWIQRFTENT
jgi:hypothetical protein